MKPKYILMSIAAVAALSSCNDFLDISPTSEATEKVVWSNVDNAELAVNYFYGNLDDFGSFGLYQSGIGLTEGLTDEMKYGGYLYFSMCRIPSEMSYGQTLTPAYVDSYMGVWGSTYENIRRVNEALAKLHASAFAEADAKRLEGELRFFRALYYFELMKRYGQAIIYDEDLSKISTNKPLDTAEACWQYILDDLTYAGKNLPVSNNAKGRLTAGAAYALMSRTMLYCENWEAVKTAVKEIEGMGYSLCPNYADAFKEDNNPEAIYMYTYDPEAKITHEFNRYYAPGSDHTINHMDLAGGYGTPTQEMVEEYEYAEGGKVDWSTWHNAEGTMQQPPYDKLEPRFQASILYNGAPWRDRTIEPFVGGGDGWLEWMSATQAEGKSTTGYYLRKLVDETQDYASSQTSSQPWVTFRLAEVYLNAAEACYRSGDAKGAADYINRVRARVKLPELKKGISGDDLFTALRHERKVELAFEGLYYWDMRRWGLATTAFTGVRRHGQKIEKLGDTFRYTYVTVDDQNMNFPSKMLRLPVPQSEIENNKDIDQFPEWK